MPRRKFYADEENPFDYSPKASTKTEYRDEEKPVPEGIITPINADEEVPPNLTGKQMGWGTINQNLGAVANRSTSNPKFYDAVVDINGKGDYTDIQKALDDGRKVLFIRKGIYKLNGDLILDSESVIKGEDKYKTIIDLNDANKIEIAGDIAYKTGTIAVNNDSKIVTGTGTAWLANLTAGDYIVFNNNYYEIDSVDNNTQVTLVRDYLGQNIAGESYFAGTFKTNIEVSNLTIKNANTECIKGTGIVNSLFAHLILTDNDTSSANGLEFENLFNSSIENCRITNSYIGVELKNSKNNYIINVDSLNNELYGFYLFGSSYNTINNFNASNDEIGIYIFDNVASNLVSDYNIINNGTISNCTNDGIKLFNSSEGKTNYNFISNCNIRNNTGDGIEMYRCRYNQIINCNISGNLGDGIELSEAASDGCRFIKIIGNNISYNTGRGVNVDEALYIVITGNHIFQNELDGIFFNTTNYSLINSNSSFENSQTANDTYSGIHLNGTCIRNVIDGNTMHGTGSPDEKYRILEDDSSDYNIFSNNQANGAQTSDIVIIGGNSIDDNNIT